MTNVTALTGVDVDNAKTSMKDVIRFEAALAMVKNGYTIKVSAITVL